MTKFTVDTAYWTARELGYTHEQITKARDNPCWDCDCPLGPCPYRGAEWFVNSTGDIEPAVIIKRRWSLRSSDQAPVFMVWDEEIVNGEVVYAKIVFNSMDLIGE